MQLSFYERRTLHRYRVRVPEYSALSVERKVDQRHFVQRLIGAVGSAYNARDQFWSPASETTEVFRGNGRVYQVHNYRYRVEA